LKRTGRRLVAGLVVAALSVSGATGVPAVASSVVAPSAVAPGLSWHRCDVHYLCSELSVPVDYADPTGAHLSLALAELPATSAHVIGDLVMNPGGPGASGVQFLETTTFPAALRSSFNLVGFDPRGTGQSDPVSCEDAAGIRNMIALDPDPQTPAQVATVVGTVKAFDRSCAEHTSMSLLENVGTRDTVRDLDLIRAALGQPKLDYMGFSYGTYIGELYAQMFPGHVRAMVLDGTVDPALSSSATVSGQAKGFETDLGDFFAWCPGNKSCAAELPQGAKVAYEKLFQGLAAGDRLMADLPAQYGGSQQVTLGLAETAAAGSLYSDQTWSYLASGIAQGLAGNGYLLAVLAYVFQGMMLNGQFSNLVAASYAISCVDRPYLKTVTAYEQLAARLVKADPDFGGISAWSDVACAYWPVPAQGPVAPIHAAGSPPILVIGSTGDPATPYPWAQAVARQLDHAELLTRTGPGHTGYINSTCIQGWTDRYLATLEMPPPGTSCASSA
jgi:pimeloyl-ACP methyl ester carboxylesterase